MALRLLSDFLEVFSFIGIKETQNLIKIDKKKAN